MSPAWVIVLGSGLVTFCLKASGPVALGGRVLPAGPRTALALMAPVLLAALVAAQAFGSGQALTLDARIIGLAVAGVGAWRRFPVPLVIVLAVVATAAVRAVQS